MHVTITYNSTIGGGPKEPFENVTDVDDTGGAFKMRWEAEGAPGYIETAIPWWRITKVEVQRGYDE